MQITPIVLMNTLLSNVQNQEQQIAQLQEEVSTGQSFQVPADNPSAVTNTMALNDTLSSVNAYLNSASSAESQLNQTNGVLQSIIQLTQGAYALSTEASNSTLNSADLTAMAETVKSDLASLGQLLNTQYQGGYLLGGTNNTQPPLQNVSGTWEWNPGASGNQGQVVQIGSDQWVTDNITGWELTSTPNGPTSPTQTSPVNAFLQLYQDLQGLQTALTPNSSGLPNIAAIQQSESQLSGDLTTMTTLQSIVGARLQRVQNAQSALNTLSVNLNQSIAQYSSANMASVTVQLAQEEQAYQATLQSGAQILPLSLLNFIKP
ncbi:MAG: flagellar biosynthesis protein FlgL [Sulfobacillus benefaciens]|uniref:Flagellar biosynthesis protein FlgL n=1 Tax=Sulfobacillus benefaciens TaxID=453960 RepID=A0A2T2XGM8_9FIRM|nr:MAG: flagellar biosynthesis protein FlgL [Sulfobacillus benefaciens]